MTMEILKFGHYKNALSENTVQCKMYLYFILFMSSFMLSILFYIHRNPSDYGVLAYASERILFGQVPYKDFFYIYSPLHAYLLAFFFKLFGIKLSTLIIYFATFNALLTIIVYEISCIIYKKNIYYVLMATFFYLFFLQSSLYVYSDRLFFGFLSLWFVMLYTETKQSFFLFSSGLVTGLSILFSQEVGISTIIGSFTIFILHQLYYSEGFFRNIILILLNSVKYTAGILVTTIPVILFLIIENVSFNAILFNLFMYPREYLHIEQESAFSLYLQNPSFSSLIYGLPLYVEMLAYIFTIVYLCYIYNKKRLETNHIYVSALLIVGILLTVSKILYQPNHSHLMFAFLPALFLIVFLFWVLNKSTSNPINNCKCIPKSAIQLISLIIIIFIISYGYYDTIRYIKNPNDYTKLETERGRILLGDSVRIDDINNVVMFLKNETKPSDHIFVACGGDPLIYFLSERKNPMYYDWFYLDNIPIQNMDELNATKQIIKNTEYLIINNDGKKLKDTYIQLFFDENFIDDSALLKKFNTYEIYNTTGCCNNG